MIARSETGARRERSEGASKAILLSSLGLQFILELSALAALGYWGFRSGSAGILMGLGAPAVAIAFWATFGSPRAPLHAEGIARVLVEALLFGAGVAALAGAGELGPAIAFAFVVTINIAVLRLLGEEG